MKKLILLITSLFVILAVATSDVFAYRTEPAGNIGAWHVVEGNRAYVHMKFPISYQANWNANLPYGNNTDRINRTHLIDNSQTLYINTSYYDQKRNIFMVNYVKNISQAISISGKKHFTQLPDIYSTLPNRGVYSMSIDNPDMEKYHNLVIVERSINNSRYVENVLYNGPGTNVKFSVTKYSGNINSRAELQVLDEYNASRFITKFNQTTGIGSYDVDTEKNAHNQWQEIVDRYPDALNAYNPRSISIYWEEAKTNQLTFNTQGGSVIATRQIKEGTTPVEPTSPTKTGYIFEGWYTTSSLSTRFNFNQHLTSDTTIYAKWITKPVDQGIINYRPNGGTNVADTLFNYGDIPSAPTAPNREGYTFDGWYLDYELRARYNFNSVLSSDITLYAKWTPVFLPVTLVVGADTSVVSVQYGSKLNQSIPTLQGFTFEGWYYDSDRTNRHDNNALITSDITLYARFIPRDTRIVNFIGFDAEELAIKEVLNLARVDYVSPNVPEGYKFEGWYESASYTGAEYDFNTPVNSDMTLYAKYIEITSSGNVDDNDNQGGNNNNNNNNPGGSIDNSNDTQEIIQWVLIGLVIIIGIAILFPQKSYRKRW